MKGKVTIGGKEYPTESRFEHIKALRAKWPNEVLKQALDSRNADQLESYTIDALMLILNPNPYKDTEDKIDIDKFCHDCAPEEFREIDKNISYLLYGMKGDEIESEKKHDRTSETQSTS